MSIITYTVDTEKFDSTNMEKSYISALNPDISEEESLKKAEEIFLLGEKIVEEKVNLEGKNIPELLEGLKVADILGDKVEVSKLLVENFTIEQILVMSSNFFGEMVKEIALNKVKEALKNKVQENPESMKHVMASMFGFEEMVEESAIPVDAETIEESSIEDIAKGISEDIK